MELFSSLTVLSLEQATTLPFLTLRLAQEGMRVIRLESPPRGDPNRWVGSEVLPDPQGSGSEKGMNAYYLPNNLGKQAITLNLKTAEGQALLHRLVNELPVDIFATNQRPRSYTKLGIDYDTLAALRPDLIWVGITGFGPDHDEAAYDPILQARAGFMELTGEAERDPMVFGLPMVDLGAAEHAYGQVMKALFRLRYKATLFSELLFGFTNRCSGFRSTSKYTKEILKPTVEIFPGADVFGSSLCDFVAFKIFFPYVIDKIHSEKLGDVLQDA